MNASASDHSGVDASYVDYSHVESTVVGLDLSSHRSGQEKLQLSAITKNESKAVFCLRMLLVVLLLVSAILVSFAVYYYTFTDEEDSFETQFESDALKLFEGIGHNFDLSMGQADSFMIRVLSQAKSTQTEWPFVTIPEWPVQAAKLIAQTDSIYFAFYPLITGEKREDWENFTKHNDKWVEESLEVQARNPTYHGPILTNYTKSNVIWRNEGPEAQDNPGPYMPSWLGSPVVPYYYPYNWNALAYEAFGNALVYSMETMSVVMAAVSNHADPSDPEAVAQAAVTSQWAGAYLAEDEDQNEPFADMYYPVLDSVNDVVLKPNNDTKALGVVAFSFFWRHILRNILPANSKGVVLLFQNPCGDQSFTYQIDGSEPIFLGFGDNHEKTESFESMAMSRKLHELTNMDGLYTGLPMNADFCPYTITAYPSSVMADDHLTSNPIIFTTVAALIFLFTSLLFLLYDWFVNRRQRLIKQRALASGAIVSSLFPQQVRDQLYKENETKETPDQFQADAVQNSLMRGSTSSTGRPNAQLYENTTIFFADLVGFTAWSSSRTPEQVFELLEAICKYWLLHVILVGCID